MTVTIVRHKNRKLYIPVGEHQTKKGFTNARGLYNLIKEGHSVKVVDAVTLNDVTGPTLAHVLYEYAGLHNVRTLEELIRGT